MQNKPLSPELETMLDVLTDYHRSQLYSFQHKQDRRAMAKNIDGDYRLPRLLNGLAEDALPRLAPYEAMCSDRIAEVVGRPPRRGYAFVPVGQRDLTVASGPGGGYLVETQVAPGDVFTGYLYNSSVLIRQGISQLDLHGNATFPKVSGKISTGWLTTEGTSLTESQFQFAMAAATPKSVGAYCEVSNLLLKQTSEAAQAFVLREMARATAAELDTKLFTGSGASGEPTGLFNVSGIGSVSGTSLAYAGILDAIKNVEEASGIVIPTRAGFVLAPNAARLLRAREKAAGSGMIMTANECGGYPAQTTKSIADGSLVFGDWSQFVLVNWGVLEVGVDPYGISSALFKSGLVGVRSIWTCDAVVLHPESFNKITSIT